MDFFNSIDWTTVIAVVLSVLVIVFAVLIGLTLIIKIFGNTLGKTKKAEINNTNNNSDVESIVSKSVVSNTVQQNFEMPVIQKGIPNDVVAAISGALAVIMGETNFKVKSITKQRSKKRSDWNYAGVLENTRPF